MRMKVRGGSEGVQREQMNEEDEKSGDPSTRAAEPRNDRMQ